MGANSKNSRRSVKTAQLGMREVNVSYLGASGDTVGGPDKLLVSSVTDLGTGNYTIILNPKAKAVEGKDAFLKGFASLTANIMLQVTAVSDDRVTVQCTDETGTAADADIQLCIGLHDWRFEYDAQ